MTHKNHIHNSVKCKTIYQLIKLVAKVQNNCHKQNINETFIQRTTQEFPMNSTFNKYMYVNCKHTEYRCLSGIQSNKCTTLKTVISYTI